MALSHGIALGKVALITGVTLVACHHLTPGVTMAASVAGLTGNLGAGFATEPIKELFKKQSSAKDLLVNGQMAKLICLAIGGLIETFGKSAKPFKDASARLQRLGPDLLANAAEDLPALDTSVVPNLLNQSPANLKNQGVGNRELWVALLRYLFADHDGNETHFQLDNELLENLADYLQQHYLNAILAVASKQPELAQKLVFRMLGAGFDMVAEVNRKVAELATRLDPVMYLPQPYANTSEFDFQNALVAFQGRRDEFMRIGGFLAGDPGFKWWRLAGPGGAGKSRFALRIAQFALAAGWQSGFVHWRTDEAYQRFANWKPTADTFLVFDYAVDHPEQAKKFLTYLAQMNRGKFRVRALLIARESSSLRWQQVVGESTSDAMIRGCLYSDEQSDTTANLFDNPGTLLNLPEMPTENLLEVSRLCWQGMKFAEPFPVEQAKQMLDNLQKMSLANLPLYVQFATVALHEGKSNFENKQDIVDVVLVRQLEKWVAAGLTQAHFDLMMYACVVGPVTFEEASKACIGLMPTKLSHAQLAALNGMSFVDPQHQGKVCPLSPDLIAEWYVLSRIRNDVYRSAFEVGAVGRAEIAWRAAKGHPNLDTFLYRVWNSFGALTDGTIIDEELSDPQRLMQLAYDIEDRVIAGRFISEDDINKFVTLGTHCKDAELQLVSAIVAANLLGRDIGFSDKLIAFLEELNEKSNSDKIKEHFARGLVSAIHPKRSIAKQAQAHIKALMELEGIAENPKLQLQYAKGLANAIHPELSTIEQAQTHVKTLLELEGRAENPELQLLCAKGVFNAIRPERSTVAQAQGHIKALMELEGRAENPELQRVYAEGLVNAINPKLSTAKQAQAHVKALLELEGRAENPELQLPYAEGLVNAIRPELSTAKQAQAHVKALLELEGRAENPELQLRYTLGLANSIHPELSAAKQAQAHIKALMELEGRAENPELQLRYAMGLANSIHPDLSTAKQAQAHIKALMELEGRAENQELQLLYAKGLFNAVHPELSTVEQAQGHIESLRDLAGSTGISEIVELRVIADVLVYATYDGATRSDVLARLKWAGREYFTLETHQHKDKFGQLVAFLMRMHDIAIEELASD